MPLCRREILRNLKKKKKAEAVVLMRGDSRGPWFGEWGKGRGWGWQPAFGLGWLPFTKRGKYRRAVLGQKRGKDGTFVWDELNRKCLGEAKWSLKGQGRKVQCYLWRSSVFFSVLFVLISNPLYTDTSVHSAYLGPAPSSHASQMVLGSQTRQ